MSHTGAAPPERIGRYEIRTLLGAGGFARVYKAFDTSLDAVVALKLLDPDMAEHPLARDRFEIEAQLLRRVDSPHVVTVFDVGEFEERPYFVMEFAKGGVLERRLPQKPGLADSHSVREIVRGIAAGLTALHQAGVVHRDIKPANILIAGHEPTGPDTVVSEGILGSGERIVLGDLGLAKDTERESDGPTILGGTPNFRAPEQGLRGAEITPSTDVYGASAVLWNVLTGEPPPDDGSIEVQLASVPPEWRPVLARGLDPDATKRYPSAAVWAEECLAVLGEAEDTALLGFRSVTAHDTCPYKGLAAFQADDAGLFFGREQLVDELVRRLQSSSALVVGGPSGSGKSSVVRAGLLPALQRGVLPGAQHWQVRLCTPGNDALAELAFHLRSITGNDNLTPNSLSDDPAAVRRSIAEGPPVLLAIDQFEELFTQNDIEVQQRVVAVLDELTADSHNSVRVVIVVRADFYDSCAHHPWLARCINDNQVLVGPMGTADLRRAIEGPAKRSGLQIEAGLVSEILSDAGASSGSLPLLAHALMETWLRRRGQQLTVAGYRDAGGVAGAISQRAEETFLGLDPDEQVLARDLVLQMVSPGDAGPDTRRQLSWSEIAHLDSSQPVIDTFVNARLITTTGQHIELAHETLLRSWPRATNWIDEARDDLRTAQHIAVAARDWNANSCDPDMLLRGTPLESALDWAAHQTRPLASQSQEFLETSKQTRDDQHERAERESARRRRNRQLVFAAMAVLLVAAALQSVNARRNENTATQATQSAQRQVNLGLAATADAQAPSDPLFALALANESAARDEQASPEALGALATARVALEAQAAAPVPLSEGIPVGNVSNLDLDASGQLLVLGDRSGEVTFFDVESRSIIQTDRTHTKGIESVEISDNLNMLVTGGADGRILLWDLSVQPFVPAEVDVIDGLAVWSAQISPDGKLLSALTSDAGVTFYDLPSRTQVATRFDSAEQRDGLRSVFTPNGSELLVGNSEGEIVRIDVASADPVGVLSPHTTNVWDVDVSAAGDYVYTASNDGTIRRIDLDTMKVDETFMLGMSSAVVEMRGIEALSNGTDIIVGAANGRVQRWHAQTGELIAQSTAAHADRIIDGAASADGSLYVSLGDDQKVRLWDLATRTVPVGQQVAQAAQPVVGLALDDDRQWATGTNTGTVLVGTMAGDQREFDVGEGRVFGLAFTPAGRLVAGDEAGRVSVLDPSDGSIIATNTTAHANRVMDIVMSPDGRHLATGGADGKIVLWDAQTFEMIRTIASIDAEVSGLAFTSDSELLSADQSGTVGFWSTDGAKTRDALPAGEDRLFSVEVDPTGTWFAVAGGTEAIAVFDLASGAKVSRLTPLAGGAVDLAFVESRVIAGLSRSGSVALWDAVSGEQLGPIMAVHRDRGEAWRLHLDSDRGIWTTGTPLNGPGANSDEGGGVFRLDVLDRTVACAATDQVFDEQRRVKFLSGEPLQAC